VISGTTNEYAFAQLFERELNPEEVQVLGDEIEVEFRNTISRSDDFKEVTGLSALLAVAKSTGIKIALATSAPPENVELTLGTLGIDHYFDVIVDNTMVTRGKPDPEVYLKAVQKLGLPTEKCVVFEDSLAGVKSALDAGLRVVGVTTTHNHHELHRAGTIHTIADFSHVSPQMFIEF
jgi:beta-phosphoglucomutase-like phosphatase (HAD superfamily)